MKTEWSRSMSYNFLYSRKRLLRQTNYCVKLNSKSNGKKISQIGLRELEKHSFCQLHFDQLIARRRCTWVSCKPMIRKVFGSVNMMVKTESTHHKRMSPNLMFAEEGWFWPKSMLTPLKWFAYYNSHITISRIQNFWTSSKIKLDIKLHFVINSIQLPMKIIMKTN